MKCVYIDPNATIGNVTYGTIFYLYVTFVFCLQKLVCCAADVLEGRGLVRVAITVSELLRFQPPKSPGHSVMSVPAAL